MNCRQVERRITRECEIESDEDRKDRIARDANEHLRQIAKGIKRERDNQRDRSRNPGIEEDEEFPDENFQLIYGNYEALTHTLESIGNKVIEEEEGSIGTIYGRTELHTSPGGRRYTIVWVDVVDHERHPDKNGEILVTVIHERIHSQDHIEDGDIDLDEDEVEDRARLIVEVLDIPEFDWSAQRVYIFSLPGWFSIDDLKDFFSVD